MNKPLLFDFSVDKENKTLHIKREFAAPAGLVWAAWTRAELLDQWWAPKPYRAETKLLDFNVGGNWLYAMVSPEGEKSWCRADYKEIVPLKSFSYLDAFCDESGVVNSDFPNSFWITQFSQNEGKTTVDVRLIYEELSDLEKIIELGFKEGFTMGLGNLDELLATIQKG